MSFRIGSKLHERLIEAAAASERSLSEEIEHRMELSFEAADAAAAAADAVRTASDQLKAIERAHLETIFSTLEKYEKLVGGKDACSFAGHASQAVALHVSRDAQEFPSAGPWWDDEARREAIRAKVVKSIGGLVDNWDFVQKSSMIPSVGWIIAKEIEASMSDGEYDTRHERALLETDAEPKKD